MKKSNCYCESVTKEYREKYGIPEGYCGICEVCNAPGHTQHFPGAVPYTGAWCNSCLIKVSRKQKFKEFGVFLVILLIAYWAAF
jgi:hypothetical protein